MNIFNKNMCILFLILVIVGIIIYNNKILEPYIFSDCNVNKYFNNLNARMFSTDDNYIKLYGCNHDIGALAGTQLNFYTVDTVPYISNILKDTSNTGFTDFSSCASNVTTAGYDFFVFNDSKCTYGDLNYGLTSDVSNLLYINCVSENKPNVGGYKNQGAGLITENGLQKLKDNNFDRLSEVNKYCNDDYNINTDFNSLESCLSTAYKKENVNEKITEMGECFSTKGNSIIDSISNNYEYVWNKFIPFNSVSRADRDIDLTNSNYINNFTDDIQFLSDTSIHDLYRSSISGYETTLANFKDTDLDFKSNFLLYLFLIIVIIIAVILVILSITNPDIVTAELVIGYVIFIALILFLGSKYFNLFKEDVNKYSHVNY